MITILMLFFYSSLLINNFAICEDHFYFALLG